MSPTVKNTRSAATDVSWMHKKNLSSGVSVLSIRINFDMTLLSYIYYRSFVSDFRLHKGVTATYVAIQNNTEMLFCLHPSFISSNAQNDLVLILHLDTRNTGLGPPNVHNYVNSLLQTQPKWSTMCVQKTAIVHTGVKPRLQKPCASENNKSSKQKWPILINITINFRYTAYIHLLLVSNEWI